MQWWHIPVLLLAIGGGFAIGYFIFHLRARGQAQEMEEEARRILEQARIEQKELLLAAKDESIRLRETVEQENKAARTAIQRQENRLHRKEELLDRRQEKLEQGERRLQQREKEVEGTHSEIEELRQEQMQTLERISQLTLEQAREQLLAKAEEDSRNDLARVLRQVEAEIQQESERLAREILSTAIQRCASDYVAEATISVVPLPNDDIKGRVIGREGRNIRAFEQLTGVDVIVDDTPESITLSAFDPVRREIARVALTRLIQDGRIHPTRIEEMVQRATKEVENTMREEAERVAMEANVQGLHPELLKLLGRLKYRTSYGQNVLEHALEVSILAGLMATELDANVSICQTAGLLHDIGKAVDHEVQGPHALIGADIVKRFGRSPAIVNAIAAHHHEQDPETVESWIVSAADAISGGRPGARRETLEHYIKRLEALETVACSFKGVENAFAIQAGREIRVMVKPDDIDDLASIRLAREIAKKIEESLQYPGQIKVTVIRETRAIDYAR
ncbi:MAG: ribonuclease Y [Chloroflexia bacterium]|nr:ribonuclease Y [Chloroflexia bacterium]